MYIRLIIKIFGKGFLFLFLICKVGFFLLYRKCSIEFCFEGEKKERRKKGVFEEIIGIY